VCVVDCIPSTYGGNCSMNLNESEMLYRLRATKINTIMCMVIVSVVWSAFIRYTLYRKLKPRKQSYRLLSAFISAYLSPWWNLRKVCCVDLTSWAGNKSFNGGNTRVWKRADKLILNFTQLNNRPNWYLQSNQIINNRCIIQHDINFN